MTQSPDEERGTTGADTRVDTGADTGSDSPTIKTVCDALIEAERELDLHEWRVGGVALWRLLRMPTYYATVKRLRLFGAPHGTSRWSGRVVERISLWLRAALSLTFRSRPPTDVLIFDHPRKVRRGDRWVDVYTESLIEELKRREVSIEVYEHLSYLNMTHVDRDHPRRYYDRIVSLSRRLAKLWPHPLSAEDRAKISALESTLKRRLGVSLKLERQARRVARAAQLMERQYLKLLKAHQPKVVVVVVAYAQSIAPLVSAAKRLSIPTVELQHGTFSPYHLGYHFPLEYASSEYASEYASDTSSGYTSDTLGYASDTSLNTSLTRAPEHFCDTFFAFGSFWGEMAQLPIPREAFKVYGFRHLNEQLARPALPRAERRDVLFISQGVIGEGLTRYALACVEGAHQERSQEVTPTLRLVYKLHPSEYKTWRSSYPELSDAARRGLIEVVDHHEESLYDLMRRARYQVGVFSTAIYEGLALGCVTLLAALPGLEYMRPLIERGRAELVESPESLRTRLAEASEDQSEGQSGVSRDDLSAEIFAPIQPDAIEWLIAHVKGESSLP